MSATHSFDVSCLRRAIELAAEARAAGDMPFGSLLAGPDGEVLVEDRNTVLTSNDITAHPELKTALWASRNLEGEVAARTTMYTSTEPCPMCCGAIYWARIRRVVFGCSAEALARLAGPGFSISARALLAHAAHPTAVLGPLLEAQAIEVHTGYW